jgi:hypothetical protein
MEDDELGPEGQTASGAADYIAELCGHLASIARRQQFDILVHILEMARLEAQGLTRTPSETPPSE